MTDETEEPNGKKFSGLLMVPLVAAIQIAVFLGASAGLVNFSETSWMTAMLMPVGGLLAAAAIGLAARDLLSSTSLSSEGKSGITLAIAVTLVVGGVIAGQSFLGIFAGVMLLLMHFLERSERHEEASILLHSVLGFILAFFYVEMVELVAGGGHNKTYSGIDAERALAATHLFAYWFLSIAVGVLATILCRGGLVAAGRGPWFASMPDNFRSKDKLDLPIALGFWVLAHVVTILTLRNLSDSDAFYSGLYLGNFWAVITAVIIMLVAYLRAERGPVLAAVIAVNWIIYTLATLQDVGLFSIWFPDSLMVWLEDERGLFTWFFITFWLNVGTLIIASKGRFGEIAPRRTKGPARTWWSTHWYGITIATAVIFGLVIRTIWNVLPAMNAAGTGLWDMTGGSDPWYMKRAVDYVVAQHSHFIIDPDRSYPVGSINPRPPLFTWSLALGGMALSWIFGIALEDAVWWSVAGLPAIFGALTVLPLASLTKRYHSKGAGAVVAWLITLMPGHVGHSTFGLADHDAFVILFFSMAFMFWLRAVDEIGHSRILPKASANPIYMVHGFQATWEKNPRAMCWALLAGISFATVGLGWKGFVYGPGILFLAFLFQVTLNMFRRRDNMALTSAALMMMLSAFLIPIPFYAHSELLLLFDASGFQPMFYILGFTLAVGWVTVSFRDKPWLLVVISGLGLAAVIIGMLALLQFVLKVYNGWDVLFTGGYYFSKNKIFGTIAEAQAPSRATLFASYGPIVAITAVAAGMMGMWKGVREEDRVSLVLSMWVLVATAMAWKAGRFIFNATPVIAVMGGVGLVNLWHRSGSLNWVKTWRRAGIATPRSRFRATRKASKEHPAVPAVLLVLLLVVSQHAAYGIDSGIPRGSEAKVDVDEAFHNIAPDLLRYDFRTGLSILTGADYAPTAYCGGCQYMGTFGPGFNGGDWNAAYQWLSEQDADVSFGERPGFVSWWDYGFQALAQGQHPTVADNFQSGIPSAGNMLLANGQQDTIALFILTLAEGDLRHGTGGFTPAFETMLNRHFDNDQVTEIYQIITLGGDDVEELNSRSMGVVARAGDISLLSGYVLDARGIPEPTPIWRVMNDGTPAGQDTISESNGWTLFNATRRGSDEMTTENTHQVIGDYWYTSDMIEDLGDVSTSLHRQNARLALGRNMIISALDLEQTVALYDDLTTEVSYTVPDSSSSPGQTIERNHDIRYFAVDSRLYPVAGAYYADANYHSYNPTGIFYAPTTLSGLDPESYIGQMYETKRGDGPIVMKTQTEYENEYLADITRQQAGGTGDVIELIDIRYTHEPAFFETMIAKVYVGYGSTTLGLPGDAAQPGQHFGGAKAQGTPKSALVGARPLPGAMMNHFSIANWYEANASDDSIGQANTGVKILKYYSGATLSGKVLLGDIGTVPNARILLERDAFSGEEEPEIFSGEVVDRDPRTYWIPIGTVDADENGEFSFRVPSGRIRVSAFMGESDLDSARDQIVSAQQSDHAEWDMDLLGQSPTPRDVNPITGILTNISGTIWIGEAIVNVSGTAGHSDGDVDVPISINVEASGASGQIVYQGHNDFDGTPITDLELEITSIYDLIKLHPYSSNLSNGTVTGDGLQFSGTGEVTFTGPGTVVSDGTATVHDFTGQFTRTILHNHSFTGDGVFDGRGILTGTVFDENGTEITNPPVCVNDTIPEGQHFCKDDGTSPVEYLVDGEIKASGRMTANGSASFTDELARESFIGSGVFTVTAEDNTLATFGTINGTGVFNGSGIFSGPMVEPGSFHLIDAIPGDYHIKVIYPDGKKVELPMPLVVGNTPSQDVAMWLPAAHLSGTLTLMNGTTFQARLDLVDLDKPDVEATDLCENVMYAPCWIDTDENGTFGFGPVIMGNYSLVLDADDDGFDELAMNMSLGNDQSRNITFGENVPITSDINFDLQKVDSGGGVEFIENQTIEFYNQDAPDTDSLTAVFNSDTGRYNIELPFGNWVVNHTLDEAHQFWYEVEVGEETGDLTMTYTYVESTWVNGTVMYDADAGKPESTLTGVPNIDVTAQWGGITTDVQTESDGSFSILLPIGVDVNLTVRTLVSQLQNGTSFTVEPGLNLTMIAENGVEIGGDVLMNRVGNLYDHGVIDWQQSNVVAYNSTYDVHWRFEIDDRGHFNGRLLPGVWNFTVDDLRLNAGWTTLDLTVENSSIKLMTQPDNITVDIRVFTDHSGDGNISNGTNRSIDFKLVPLAGSTHGVAVNISADDAVWTADGVAQVSVELGAYRVEIEGQNASADPPQAWNTRLVGGAGDSVYGLDNGTEILEIPLSAEWYVNALLKNETGDSQENRQVTFAAIDGDESFTLTTGENGTIMDYLPEGEWLVTVDPHSTNGSDIKMEYRGILTIDESTAPLNITWELIESVHMRIYLTDAATGDGLNSYILTAESQDGLGSVTLAASSDGGYISVELFPGEWTVSINRTDGQYRWIIDNLTLGDLAGGTIEDDVNISAERWVSMGGAIFWDIDDDENSDTSEGVEGANVTVTSTGLSEPVNITTGEDGIWEMFAPVRENYSISVVADGFSNGSTEIELSDEPNGSADIKLIPGSVEVSGNISFIQADVWSTIADDITLTLYPKAGFERALIMPTKEIVNGTWTGFWNATVEPGEWVVHAVSPDDGYVSIGQLHAAVNDGGNVDLELTIAGTIRAITVWYDFEGQSHTLADESVSGAAMLSPAKITIKLADATQWNVSVESDGSLNLLLPEGDVEFDSGFETTERGRTMDYNGGLIITVAAQQESPEHIVEFKRRELHGVTTEVIQQSGGSIHDSEPDDVDLVESGSEFQAVTFTVHVTYDGNEAIDLITMSHDVTGGDQEYWFLEYLNGTDSEDASAWNDTLSFELGLDGELERDVLVRITPANVSVARAFSNGHQINIRFAAGDGTFSDQKITMRVPQTYGVELAIQPDAIYGITDGGDQTITTEWRNTGNGDDTFSVDIDDSSLPDGWTVTGPTVLTIGKNITQSQSITVRAPAEAADGSHTITVTLKSEDNTTTASTNLVIRIARPVLEIVSIGLRDGGEPIAGRVNVFVIEVRNSGLVTADPVVLETSVRDYSMTFVSDFATIEPNDSHTFEMSLNLGEVPVGTHWFDFELNTSGIDVENVPEKISDQYSVRSPPAEGTNWMIPVFIVAAVAIILFLVNKARRAGSTPF